MASSKPVQSVAIEIPNFDIRDDYLFLIVLVALALVLRLDFLIANHFVIDADEAIVGLMGKHIIEGRGLPVFYYGQNYMGSLEAVLAGLVFLIFGVSSIALKSVPLFFSLVLVVLIYQLGLELGSRAVARTAALFAAIPPQMLVIWSSMARGGFLEVVCIGTVALILSLRWLRESEPKPALTAGIFALLGIGWWVNNQIVYFLVPIAYLVACRLLRPSPGVWNFSLRTLAPHAIAAAGAFFVGGSPYWVYNLQHHFVSFEIAKGATGAQVLDHIAGLGSTALPMILGARRQWHSEEVFPYASAIAYAVYGTLLLFLLWKRRRTIKALPSLILDRRHPIELFVLFVFVTYLIFALSSYGSLVESPRYLLPSYVGIFVLAAVSISMLKKRSAILSVAATSAIVGLNLASCYLGGRGLPGEPFVFQGERVSKDHQELILWLKDHGMSLVRTNYWIGYRLAFESKEAIRFSIYQTPDTVRIQSYEVEARVRDREFLPLVLVPSQARLIERAYLVEGITYKREVLSGYVVLYDISPTQSNLESLSTSDELAGATDNGTAATLAIDGNIGTRWGSAKPQYAGMKFWVALKEPKTIRGIRYQLGNWTHDEPRELRIELELASGQLKELLRFEDYEAVRYAREGTSLFQFVFSPVSVRRVIFTQGGTQRVFDWSVAEVELLK